MHASDLEIRFRPVGRWHYLCIAANGPTVNTKSTPWGPLSPTLASMATTEVRYTLRSIMRTAKQRPCNKTALLILATSVQDKGGTGILRKFAKNYRDLTRKTYGHDGNIF